MGRYGNLTAEFSADVHHYAEFLFSRGHERESFWLEWNESHKEPVVLVMSIFLFSLNKNVLYYNIRSQTCGRTPKPENRLLRKTIRR